jgi:hypothetical protein
MQPNRERHTRRRQIGSELWPDVVLRPARSEWRSFVPRSPRALVASFAGRRRAFGSLARTGDLLHIYVGHSSVTSDRCLRVSSGPFATNSGDCLDGKFEESRQSLSALVSWFVLARGRHERTRIPAYSRARSCEQELSHFFLHLHIFMLASKRRCLLATKGVWLA